MLQGLGVGYRQVAHLAGVSTAYVKAIRTGQQPRISPSLETKILAVKALLAPGQRVKAWPTWRLIKLLFREGFTKAEIARRLHYDTERLPFELKATEKYIRVRTALRVRGLYRRITADGPDTIQ